MSIRLLLVVATLVLAPALADAQVLTGLRLVDPATREVVEASLRVDDGRIAAIGSADGAEFDPALPRVDLAGAWALPAFFDASIIGQTQVSPGHRDRLDPADTARLLRAAGIGAALDLDAAAGPAAPGRGARRLRAGPVLTAVDGVGSEIPGARTLADAAAARSVAGELLRSSSPPDRLSVIFDRSRNRRGLVPEALEAILQEAGGAAVAVYVGSWRDAEDALRAGARWLVQIPPGPVPDAVLELVRLNAPVWTPSVAVGADFMALMDDVSLRGSPALARSLPDAMRADYGEVRVPKGRLEEARLQNADRLASLAALDAAGAVLVAGSQSGGLGTAHGWSLLRELQWWWRAGLDPWTILAGATLNGPELLGRTAGFVVGAPASFTVYASSPLDSAQVLLEPSTVFVEGVAVDPGPLAAAVMHSIAEDVPHSPLPGDNAWSMVLIAIAAFSVLLFLRHLVRRAAARADAP